MDEFEDKQSCFIKHKKGFPRMPSIFLGFPRNMKRLGNPKPYVQQQLVELQHSFDFMVFGLVCGKPHEAIITEFLDKYFIIVTYNGKIGTLVSISFETNAMKKSTSLVSKVLFGKDKPEVLGVAHSIVEVLDLKKPVIFGFSVQEYNSTASVDIRNMISNAIQEKKKENSLNQDSAS